MANLMRKMWTKHQVKQIVNDGIKHGEIIGSYLLNGYFLDSGDEFYLILPLLTNENNNIYYVSAYHIDAGQRVLLKIDFANNKIYDEDEVEIIIGSSNIYLQNTLNSATIKMIEI